MAFHNMEKMKFENYYTPPAPKRARTSVEELVNKKRKAQQLLQELDKEIDETVGMEYEEADFAQREVADNEEFENMNDWRDVPRDEQNEVPLENEQFLTNNTNSIDEQPHKQYVLLKTLNELISDDSLDTFRVGCLLKSAVDNDVTIWQVIQEFVKLHGNKKITFFTRAENEKKLFDGQLYQYCNMLENALNSSRISALERKVGRLRAGAEFDLGELKPDVLYITTNYVIPGIHPFKKTEIKLTEIPTQTKGIQNHVFLGRLLKFLLEEVQFIATSCHIFFEFQSSGDPNAFKKLTRHNQVITNDSIRIPPEVKKVLYDFVSTLFGLRVEMVENPFVGLEKFQNLPYFVKLGNSFEERKLTLMGIRRIAQNFREAFETKLAEKIGEVRRQAYIIEDGGRIKWLPRKHKKEE